MKKNSVDNLNKLKEVFNNLINEKIENVALDNIINEDVDNLSFGGLVNIMDNISYKLFEDKKGKRLISQYLNIILENENLKEMSLLYAESKRHHDNPEQWLNESLSIVTNNEKIDGEKLNTLRNIVKEAVSLVGVDSNTLTTILNEGKNGVYSMIDNLIENYGKMNKVDDFVSTKQSLLESIKNTEKPADTTEYTVESIENLLNEETTEWVKELSKNIFLSNLANKPNSILFEDYKQRCVNKIEDMLNEDVDVETYSRLHNMKEKLMEKKYSDATFNDDIVNLAELEFTLDEQ